MKPSQLENKVLCDILDNLIKISLGSVNRNVYTLSKQLTTLNNFRIQSEQQLHIFMKNNLKNENTITN